MGNAFTSVNYVHNSRQLPSHF